ncbi:MAG TPA: polysaccharide biosynthesis protein, partial [Acidobacteriota bacterium]|nr:polysaccharide biosynthesis protein [Acidobacteriota bacterium]
GWAGMPLCFLWIVGLTNAFNFMDGIDGIAGAQAIVAGAGWAALGWQSGQAVVAVLGVLVAFASLGFLSHNWPPARVFMGDVGSSFLGYTFAVLPLLQTHLSNTGEPGAIPAMGVLLLWPFVFDTAFTFASRLLKKENVFHAHKTHLYQRLVQAGHSHRSVTLIYAALALVGVALGEVWAPGTAGEAPGGLVAVPFLCLGLWKYVRDEEYEKTSLKPSMKTHFLRYRRLAIVLSQAALLTLTYLLSFVLRLDFSLNEPYRIVFLKTLPVALIIQLGVFAYFRLFRGWWRYVGVSDLLDIVKAAVISAPLIYAGVHLVYGFLWFPRSVFIIDPILTILVIGGTRFAVRMNAEHARRYFAHTATVIVGAGREGDATARELLSNERLNFYPIGFVDDDPTKKGIKIQGIKVLGGTGDLPRIIKENEVAHVLIALPSASGKEIQRIIETCRECKADVKTVPALGDLITNSVSTDQIRNVRVEDLLQRKPVQLDLAKIRAKFQGRAALITGAAGSIGAELARQLAAFNPSKLVLFDRSESDLHEFSLSLAETCPSLHQVPVIGDILDVNRLREVHSVHHPHLVFHAAAYKHVPLLERNCFQAVTNNIFGTYNAALVARQYEVEDFVLISSDKAANPTSVMGVTKRVAELLILGLQQHATRYVSVRFGNVLGSRGSVIPIFERQIAHRTPVTVTDPEAKTCFITASDAVQLVLQAATMADGGEIFILDMGEPVKVLDVARDLIRLSGLEPDRDIPIVFTGLRPGEELAEGLKPEGEGIGPTAHERIKVLAGGEVSFAQVSAWLDELSALVNSKNVHGLVTALKEIVPDYVPSKEILAQAELDRHDKFVTYDRDRAGLTLE